MLELGQVVVTRGVMDAINNDAEFAAFVTESFGKYLYGDWGDMCNEDKKMNDAAVNGLDDRVVARYNHHTEDIYIITEWDRSATTILFCNEY